MKQHKEQQEPIMDRLDRVKSKTTNDRLKESIEKKQEYINSPKVVRK